MIEFLNPYLPEWLQVLLVSLSGTGLTLFVVLKFCANKTLEIFLKNLDFKKAKELEAYKGLLGNKNYISKVRFDAEFQIYRELSSAFFDSLFAVTMIIPAKVEDFAHCHYTLPQLQEKYEKSIEANRYATSVHHKNAAFVSEELYNDYDNILKLMTVQTQTYGMQLSVINQKLLTGTFLADADMNFITLEQIERTMSIHSLSQDLNKKVRNYLSNLEVIK